MNRLLSLMSGTLTNRPLRPVSAFLVSQFLSVIALFEKLAASVMCPIRVLPRFGMARQTLSAIGLTLIARPSTVAPVIAQTCGDKNNLFMFTNLNCPGLS